MIKINIDPTLKLSMRKFVVLFLILPTILTIFHLGLIAADIYYSLNGFNLPEPFWLKITSSIVFVWTMLGIYLWLKGYGKINKE